MSTFRYNAFVGVLALSACLLSSCDRTAKEADAGTSPVRAMPDVGGVTTEKVTATGVGPTEGAAVDQALRMAIMQVNGHSVASEQIAATLQASAWLNEAKIDFGARQAVEVVSSRSNGAVTDFRITGRKRVAEGWEITVDANVAKYQVSAEANRPRIVIATPYAAAGAGAYVSGFKTDFADAIIQSNRFAVLDRDFASERQSELGMVEAGETNVADLARLGQAMSADLVAIPEIRAIGGDRVAVSLRLINVATSQISLSQSFEASASSGVPAALDRLAGEMTRAVLLRTFPISVVELQGQDVILNQGGAALESGRNYRAVSLGREIKDPQTGRSLGRVEQECCVIQITRVSNDLSYGRVVSASALPQPFTPGTIELREVVAAPQASQASASPATPKRAATPARRAPAGPPAGDKDENW